MAGPDGGEALGPRAGLLGRVGARSEGLSGAEEGQAAVAVKLEQVVDCALEAPLRTRGVLATQQQPLGVLDGLHLSEYRLDYCLAPSVNGVPLLGFQLARHALLGGRVLRGRSLGSGRLWL